MKDDKIASLFEKLLSKKREQAEEGKKVRFVQSDEVSRLENNRVSWFTNPLPGSDRRMSYDRTY